MLRLSQTYMYLQPVTGEWFSGASTNTEYGARWILLQEGLGGRNLSVCFSMFASSTPILTQTANQASNPLTKSVNTSNNKLMNKESVRWSMEHLPHCVVIDRRYGWGCYCVLHTTGLHAGYKI